METEERKAAEFLRQRLALVSEIDKTEFQWKKRKREIQEKMARFLAEHERSSIRAKEIRAKINSVELDDRRFAVNKLAEELGFKSVNPQE